MSYHARDCELVLGLVSPVGVNHDDIEGRLKDFLKQFNYDVNYIHLSKISDKYFPNWQKEAENEVQRLDFGMETGTKIREHFGRGDMYALAAIAEINSNRGLEGENKKPSPRTIHIIRSLKHADEVNTLREVYGNGFFLLGISARNETRKEYLKNQKGVPEEEVERLIARDDKEKNPLGQQTRNVFQLSDAFITTDDHERLSHQLIRILELLFSNPHISPNEEEYAMFMAYAASLRSADLSRQVGAVLANAYGDIISTGANDVPRFGGGLYWPTTTKSGIEDERDYVWKKDMNEEERNKIIEEVIDLAIGENEDEEKKESARQRLKKSRINDLTEFGRAVHAEMEALLQASRTGVSVRGSRLYTTTFPCHNCAKHIVAAGVQEVIYIEPYPKSYAKNLHRDSIDTESKSAKNKVNFRQFVGIGPRKFIDLFSMNLGNGRKIIRKENGENCNWERWTSELRIPMPPLSYLDSEIAISTELQRILEEPQEEAER
jgi:deoxycytidylate deaminase